jgi:exonuclease SbcC
MKIDSVLIENIRSHVKTYVKFSNGFNCLVGGLGAGKTSILYAIDFALFGDPMGRSYEYLLREGSDAARVALKFIEGGREYTVWRGLRRRGDRISQDPEQLKLFEGNRLIAEIKSEAVAEQLKSAIGMDKEVFRSIVWIRQERLKEILDMMPAERQKLLDQLFGISDYETSWVNFRSIQRWYESEQSALERDPDVIGIREFQSRYNEAVKELAAKEAELEGAKKMLIEAELRLKEASANLEELMEMRKRSEELRAREADLKSRVKSLESVCARLADEFKERKMKINELDGRLEILNSQEEVLRRKLASLNLPAGASLQGLQAYINSIIERISSIRGEEENVRGEIKRVTQRISSIVKENKCPICLQNLSPEYKDSLMRQFYEEISSYRQRLNELERGVRELEQLRSTLFAIFSSLQTINPKKEEILRQIEDEKRALNRVSEELKSREAEINVLKKQIDEISLAISEFDYARLEGAQRQYNEAFERYSNLKYRVQALEAQRSEVMSRLDNFKWRIDIAQKKIERLEKIKKILAFAEEARQAYRSIQPKIRKDFISYLEKMVQQILDELSGSERLPLTVRIDENYTPIIEGEEKYERSVHNLSGGERTFTAIAYRLGIGQIIMYLRFGRGLSILLLDEPTESLGREDGSISRLAEMLSRLKSIEQIIAVTHSEAFAEKADRVIRVEKRDGRSIVLGES